jgi:hypothetical protein
MKMNTMKSNRTRAFTLALLSTGVLAFSPVQAQPGMNDPAFVAAMQHANFMPTLMRIALANQQALGLSQSQVDTLKKYNQDNSPQQREDMMNVQKLEQEAASYALQKDLVSAQIAGQESIALRQTIFNQKFRCHMFVQSLLTPAQYEQLLKLAQSE